MVEVRRERLETMATDLREEAKRNREPGETDQEIEAKVEAQI